MNEIVRERWTNAEDLILLSMHQAGTPVLDIARALGKTYGATQTRVNRKGCGRSATTVQRRKWTDAENARLIALGDEGRPMAEVAADLGRSEVATLAQAAKLGVAGARDSKLWAKTKSSGIRKSGNTTNYAGQGKTSKEKGIRECLTCRRPFMSDWKGNRRCKPCKDRTASEGLDD